MHTQPRTNSRHSKWRAIAAVAAVAAVFAATQIPRNANSIDLPAAHAAPHQETTDDHMLCGGGATSDFDIQLRNAPDTRNPMSLGLALDVTNRSRANQDISFAVEVLNVKGEPQTQPHLAAPKRVPQGARTESLPIETPRGLANGYYRLVVTTLTTDADGHEQTGTREVYLHSNGGKPRIVSHDEWYENSGIQEHGQQLFLEGTSR